MLRGAYRAVPPPARLRGFCRLAAVRTETMPFVPEQERLRRRERRQVFRRQQSLERDRAQVHHDKVAACLDPFDALRRNRSREMTAAVRILAEHCGLERLACIGRFVVRETRVETFAALCEQEGFAGQRRTGVGESGFGKRHCWRLCLCDAATTRQVPQSVSRAYLVRFAFFRSTRTFAFRYTARAFLHPIPAPAKRRRLRCGRRYGCATAARYCRVRRH